MTKVFPFGWSHWVALPQKIAHFQTVSNCLWVRVWNAVNFIWSVFIVTAPSGRGKGTAVDMASFYRKRFTSSTCFLNFNELLDAKTKETQYQWMLDMSDLSFFFFLLTSMYRNRRLLRLSVVAAVVKTIK